MADWKSILKKTLLLDGKIDAEEVAVLKAEILADGVVDREELDFLIELRNGAKTSTDAYEGFFFAALESHLMADGKIDADEVVLVRKILMADGKIDAGEKAFIKALAAKAKNAHPDLAKLVAEVG